MSIDVSVILPTFNRSGSLPAAISSVLNQSTANLELIVVDDASTEDIKGLVSGINDQRLRYIRHAVNGGAAAARNTGLAAAAGEYIAFQDSDDVWLPGKLEAQLALFARLPAEIGVVTGPKILYGRQRGGAPGVAITPSPKGRLHVDDDQLGRILEENRLSVQCALFKKSRFPQREWFDSRAKANEDWEFAVRLVQHTRIYEDAEPVVLGFVSSDSISLNRRRQIMGVLRILKQNKAVLSAYRRQRSALMRDVGRSLYKTKKRRWAMRFLLASVADYPPSVFLIAETLWRGLRGAFALARRRMGAA